MKTFTYNNIIIKLENPIGDIVLVYRGNQLMQYSNNIKAYHNCDDPTHVDYMSSRNYFFNIINQ